MMYDGDDRARCFWLALACIGILSAPTSASDSTGFVAFQQLEASGSWFTQNEVFLPLDQDGGRLFTVGSFGPQQRISYLDSAHPAFIAAATVEREGHDRIQGLAADPDELLVAWGRDGAGNRRHAGGMSRVDRHTGQALPFRADAAFLRMAHAPNARTLYGIGEPVDDATTYSLLAYHVPSGTLTVHDSLQPLQDALPGAVLLNNAESELFVLWNAIDPLDPDFPSGNLFLTVHDLETGGMRDVVALGEGHLSAQPLAIDSDDSRLFMAFPPPQDPIRILDVATLNVVQTIDQETLGESNLLSGPILRDPDRDLLYVSLWDTIEWKIGVWNLTSATLEGTIPTGVAVGALALDTRLRRLFAANRISDNLTVAHADTREVLAKVDYAINPLGVVHHHPDGIDVLTAAGNLYRVANHPPRMVERISITDSIASAPGLTVLLADAERGRMYASRGRDQAPLALDIATMEAVGELPHPASSLVLDASRDRIHAFPLSGSPARISIVSATDLSLLDAFPEQPDSNILHLRQAILNPTTGRLHAYHVRTRTLATLDPLAETITYVNLPQGFLLQNLDLDHVRQQLVLLGRRGTERLLLLLDIATGEVTQEISGLFPINYALALDPEHALAYVLGQDLMDTAMSVAAVDLIDATHSTHSTAISTHSGVITFEFDARRNRFAAATQMPPGVHLFDNPVSLERRPGPPPPPFAPDLLAPITHNRRVDLRWAPPPEGVLDIQVERAREAGPFQVLTARPIPSGLSAFTDMDVVDGAMYRYRLRARDHLGQYGLVSDIVAATPGVVTSPHNRLVPNRSAVRLRPGQSVRIAVRLLGLSDLPSATLEALFLDETPSDLTVTLTPEVLMLPGVARLDITAASNARRADRTLLLREQGSDGHALITVEVIPALNADPALRHPARAWGQSKISIASDAGLTEDEAQFVTVKGTIGATFNPFTSTSLTFEAAHSAHPTLTFHDNAASAGQFSRSFKLPHVDGSPWTIRAVWHGTPGHPGGISNPLPLAFSPPPQHNTRFINATTPPTAMLILGETPPERHPVLAAVLERLDAVLTRQRIGESERVFLGAQPIDGLVAPLQLATAAQVRQAIEAGADSELLLLFLLGQADAQGRLTLAAGSILDPVEFATWLPENTEAVVIVDTPHGGWYLHPAGDATHAQLVATAAHQGLSAYPGFTDFFVQSLDYPLGDTFLDARGIFCEAASSLGCGMDEWNVINGPLGWGSGAFRETVIGSRFVRPGFPVEDSFPPSVVAVSLEPDGIIQVGQDATLEVEAYDRPNTMEGLSAHLYWWIGGSNVVGVTLDATGDGRYRTTLTPHLPGRLTCHVVLSDQYGNLSQEWLSARVAGAREHLAPQGERIEHEHFTDHMPGVAEHRLDWWSWLELSREWQK